MSIPHQPDVPGKYCFRNRRTPGRVMDVMTSDEHGAYPAAILADHGEEVVPEPTGQPGRLREEFWWVPEELVSATMHKVREDHLLHQVTVGHQAHVLRQRAPQKLPGAARQVKAGR